MTWIHTFRFWPRQIISFCSHSIHTVWQVGMRIHGFRAGKSHFGGLDSHFHSRFLVGAPNTFRLLVYTFLTFLFSNGSPNPSQIAPKPASCHIQSAKSAKTTEGKGKKAAKKTLKVPADGGELAKHAISEGTKLVTKFLRVPADGEKKKRKNTRKKTYIYKVLQVHPLVSISNKAMAILILSE
jgi:hypothetical protein